MEKSWAKQFNREICTSTWEKIYVNRIYKLPDNKLSEFMYKLINNLIVCRKTLFKWKKIDTDLCPVCNKEETVKHIYFECKNVQELWIIISDVLKVDLTWEKIVLGFVEDLSVHSFRNLVIGIVLYARYKFWLKGLDEKV